MRRQNNITVSQWYRQMETHEWNPYQETTNSNNDKHCSKIILINSQFTDLRAILIVEHDLKTNNLIELIDLKWVDYPRGDELEWEANSYSSFLDVVKCDVSRFYHFLSDPSVLTIDDKNSAIHATIPDVVDWIRLFFPMFQDDIKWSYCGNDELTSQTVGEILDMMEYVRRDNLGLENLSYSYQNGPFVTFSLYDSMPMNEFDGENEEENDDNDEDTDSNNESDQERDHDDDDEDEDEDENEIMYSDDTDD